MQILLSIKLWDTADMQVTTIHITFLHLDPHEKPSWEQDINLPKMGLSLTMRTWTLALQFPTWPTADVTVSTGAPARFTHMVHVLYIQVVATSYEPGSLTRALLLQQCSHSTSDTQDRTWEISWFQKTTMASYSLVTCTIQYYTETELDSEHGCIGITDLVLLKTKLHCHITGDMEVVFSRNGTTCRYRQCQEDNDVSLPPRWLIQPASSKLISQKRQFKNLQWYTMITFILGSTAQN